MGSLTIQVIGDVSVGTKNRTFNFSDANINRLVDFGEYIYKNNPDNPPGNPTVAQALNAWAVWVVDHTKSKLREAEERVARDAVPPPASFDPT
jgi:hypothetical protein